MHLDFNNQYEHAFSEPVSYGEFEWAENKAMFSDNFIKKLQQKYSIYFFVFVFPVLLTYTTNAK